MQWPRIFCVETIANHIKDRGPVASTAHWHCDTMSVHVFLYDLFCQRRDYDTSWTRLQAQWNTLPFSTYKSLASLDAVNQVNDRKFPPCRIRSPRFLLRQSPSTAFRNQFQHWKKSHWVSRCKADWSISKGIRFGWCQMNHDIAPTQIGLERIMCCASTLRLNCAPTDTHFHENIDCTQFLSTSWRGRRGRTCWSQSVKASWTSGNDVSAQQRRIKRYVQSHRCSQQHLVATNGSRHCGAVRFVSTWCNSLPQYFSLDITVALLAGVTRKNSCYPDVA